MGVTFVTALYDLARREPEIARRTAEHYLEISDFVLGLDADVIAFADPELAPALERRGGAGRIHVEPLAFERLAAYPLAAEIAAARERHPITNANPDKDTPLYAVLQWSKLELLERGAALRPGATHLAWIDLGLPGRKHPADGAWRRPVRGVRLLMLRPWTRAELADTASYLSAIRGHIAGGFLSGERERVLRLCGLFGEVSRAQLAAGFAPSEEQLLPLLAEAEPGLFEFHHGNYEDVLRNFATLRGGAGNLAFQVRVAREAGLGDLARSLCKQVLASCEAGTFEAEPAELAALLDECFLAAWYGPGDGRALAREVAAAYLERAGSDPGFREAFLREEIRVRSNFALLDG